MDILTGETVLRLHTGVAVTVQQTQSLDSDTHGNVHLWNTQYLEDVLT